VAGFGTAAADDRDDVVVVATRSPVTPDKIGNEVTVLNAEAIQKSQATLVSDLLVTTPGVTLSRAGGPGELTAIRIRGAEAGHTLVLIDGVQMNDPSSTDGAFDFGNLLVGDISRIEILRGSQSTLYGSQAIGGVVNIVTALPSDTLTGNVEAEGGSYDEQLIKGALGGRLDRFSFRLGAGHYRTDGVSAFAGGSETDPFSNSTFTGRVNYDFTDDVKLDLRAYYADSKYHADGFPPPNYTFADEADFGINRQFVGYGGLDFKLFDGALENRVAYQLTNTDRGTFLDDGTSVFSTGKYQGKNRRYEYQGTWRISDAYRMVFGYQHENTEMNSEVNPTHAEADLNSVYVQLQAEVIQGLTFTAGERHDDHDTFGTHDTGQIAVAYALPSDTVLRASWGQGFKAPTLYQLYSDYFNHDLQPEQSHGWDAGISQRLSERHITLGATYFSRDTTNQIDFVDCPFPANSICSLPGHSTFGFYDNIGRTEARGVELEGSLSVEGVVVSVNYTHMKAVDKSPGSDSFNQRLLHRPDTLANLSVSYRWRAGLETSVSARYSGPSFDENFDVFPAERVTLGGFTLVDVRGSYAFNDHVSLYGRFENVLDRRYQTILNYGTLGRGGFLGVNVKL
jgi:vitamin B12 transporter